MAVNDRSLFQTETHGRPTFLGGLRLRRLFYISALKTNPLERWLMVVVWGGGRGAGEREERRGGRRERRGRGGERTLARARASARSRKRVFACCSASSLQVRLHMSAPDVHNYE